MVIVGNISARRFDWGYREPAPIAVGTGHFVQLGIIGSVSTARVFDWTQIAWPVDAATIMVPLSITVTATLFKPPVAEIDVQVSAASGDIIITGVN